MWTPPWRGPYALGAFGLAPVEDRIIADRVVADVAANIAAGRKFYDPVPEEFKAHFQRSARGIYNYLIYSQYMPKALTPSEQQDLAVRVVNKTFYNALRGIAGYQAEAKLKGWYYKIARNALIDELRMFIRSPRGREIKGQISFDSQTDVGRAVALAREAEAVAAKEDYSELPVRFQDQVTLIQQLMRAGHDARGREYLSQESRRTLQQWIRARGDIDTLAEYLSVDEQRAEDMYQKAQANFVEAAGRLRRST